MSLKILHVLDHSVPLHSGYSFRTLSILREQAKRGWQTLQLTTPKQGRTGARRETVDGFEFVRTAGAVDSDPLRQMVATARQIAHTVAEFRPDIIHAHSPVLTALPSLYVARRRRVPLVYEVRATWEDAAVDHGTTHAESLRYRLSKGVETFVLKRVEHVTTICEGLRQEILGRGVSPEKVTVIPNAVDIDRFPFGRPINHALRARLGVGDRAVVIGFIGSFYAYEGLDVLLEAVALLNRAGHHLHALLVGGGPQRSELERQAAALRLGDRVHFAGRVSHDAVQDYYDAIDVLVYPRKRTRLTDTVTPLKPLEAMAQGKLVVASNVGGHLEMIRDCDTGRLFAAGDAGALAECLSNVLESRLEWMATLERARAYVRNERNWERSVAGYAGAYRAALACRGRNIE